MCTYVNSATFSYDVIMFFCRDLQFEVTGQCVFSVGLGTLGQQGPGQSCGLYATGSGHSKNIR